MATSQTRLQLLTAVAACEDKKAEDTRILELDPSDAGLADFFLITSASNDRQVLAIADEIEYRLKKQFGLYPASVEGRRQAEWILLDYVDIVVHVFLAEKRAFYDIERLRKSARPLSSGELEAELKSELAAKTRDVRTASPGPRVKKAVKKSARKAPTTSTVRPKPKKGTSAVSAKPAKKVAKKAVKKAAKKAVKKAVKSVVKPAASKTSAKKAVAKKAVAKKAVKSAAKKSVKASSAKKATPAKKAPALKKTAKPAIKTASKTTAPVAKKQAAKKQPIKKAAKSAIKSVKASAKDSVLAPKFPGEDPQGAKPPIVKCEAPEADCPPIAGAKPPIEK